MAIRVLYADDLVMTRERVVPMLQLLGAEVTEFGILSQAKDAFVSEKFDAVVVDGSLQNNNDGWGWASELHVQGVRVMVHSSDNPPKQAPSNLIHLDKGASLQDTRNFFARFLKDA